MTKFHLPVLLRLVLFGMAWLAIAASLVYGDPDRMPVWVVAAPLGFLATILVYAIITRPRLHRNA